MTLLLTRVVGPHGSRQGSRVRARVCVMYGVGAQAGRISPLLRHESPGPDCWLMFTRNGGNQRR